MRAHRIAAIGGNGIEPEMAEAGSEVLRGCAERGGGFHPGVEPFDSNTIAFMRENRIAAYAVMGERRVRGLDGLPTADETDPRSP